MAVDFTREQAAGMLAQVASWLLGSLPVAEPAVDETLTADQAAAILGIAPATLLKRRPEYLRCRVHTGARRVAFSRQRILALRAESTGAETSAGRPVALAAPSPPAPPRFAWQAPRRRSGR